MSSAILMDRTGHFPTSGASKIAFRLQAEGHSCSVLSTTPRSYQDKTFSDVSFSPSAIASVLSSAAPKVIGVSLLSHDIPYFLNVLSTLAKRDPALASGALFLFGGAGAIMNPEFVSYAFRFLNNTVVVAGPGEHIVAQALSDANGGRMLSKPMDYPFCIVRSNGQVSNNLHAADPSRPVAYGRHTSYLVSLLRQNWRSLVIENPKGVFPRGDEYAPVAVPIYLDLPCAGRCAFCSMSNPRYRQYSQVAAVSPKEFPQLIKEIVDIVSFLGSKIKCRILFTNDDFFASREFTQALVAALRCLQLKGEIPSVDFWATGRCQTALTNVEAHWLCHSREQRLAMRNVRLVAWPLSGLVRAPPASAASHSAAAVSPPCRCPGYDPLRPVPCLDSAAQTVAPLYWDARQSYLLPARRRPLAYDSRAEPKRHPTCSYANRR